MLVYILFILGLIILITGADLLIDGSVAIARRFKVSPLVIGLTVVAMGTSAPELFVNVTANLRGSSAIAIGNILGSNIANILLVLGIGAAIYPFKVHKNVIRRDVPFSLLAIIITALLINDPLFNHTNTLTLGRIDGFILLAFFLVFLYYTISVGRKDVPEEKGGVFEQKEGLGTALRLVTGGAIGLFLGGEWVVRGAIAIAEVLNLSEAFIGLTIIAIGTSLPELATSITAAVKKHPDIAIGNVVGSNVFNIFWVLGLSAAIKAIPVSAASNLDLWVAVMATVLLFLSLFMGKRHAIERWQGILFLVIYGFYIIMLLVR